MYQEYFIIGYIILNQYNNSINYKNKVLPTSIQKLFFSGSREKRILSTIAISSMWVSMSYCSNIAPLSRSVKVVVLFIEHYSVNSYRYKLTVINIVIITTFFNFFTVLKRKLFNSCYVILTFWNFTCSINDKYNSSCCTYVYWQIKCQFWSVQSSPKINV